MGNWSPPIGYGIGSPKRVNNLSPSIGYGIGSPKKVGNSSFPIGYGIFKFSFVPRTVKDWNSLPRSAVEIVEDGKFRNYLLSMIL